MSFEQVCFKAFKDAFALDVGAGNLVVLLPGNKSFVRDDGSTDDRSEPYITFALDERSIDSVDSQIVEATVRLTTFTPRNRSFGTGSTPEAAGPVDLILNRFDVVFQDVALSATGWTLSPCGESGRFRLAPTLSAIKRMVEYRLTGVKT